MFQMAGPEGRRTIVVIGEGLLGGAVSDRIRRGNPLVESHRSTNWSEPPASLGSDLARLLDGLEPSGSAEVIWTAGEAGMQLPDFDHTAHRTRFASQLQAVEAAAAAHATTVRFHLASSAGALGPPTPSPRAPTQTSPYAERKRIEEETLLDLGDAHRVYRIASAYGAPTASGRAGVIGLLIRNSLLGRETELFARPSTLRNYVHHHDVAEAMLRALDVATDRRLLLAADRSHTMSEVLAEVGRVVRRAVPVIHRPPANDHDMVFDPAAASPLLPQRSLAAGVRSTYDALLSR